MGESTKATVQVLKIHKEHNGAENEKNNIAVIQSSTDIPSPMIYCHLSKRFQKTRFMSIDRCF